MEIVYVPLVAKMMYVLYTDQINSILISMNTVTFLTIVYSRPELGMPKIFLQHFNMLRIRFNISGLCLQNDA